MSTSLFKSRQQKSKKNLKNLSISSPFDSSNSLASPISLLSPSSIPSPRSLSTPIINQPLNDLSSPTLSKFNSNHSPINYTFSSNSKAFVSSTSSPTSINSETFSDNAGTVILMCKYEFNGENHQELSIKPRDYVKLLSRLGDGWLKVKHIGNNNIGLIPASYVKIAVNDLVDPITLNWLTEIKPFASNSDIGFDHDYGLNNNSTVDFNGKNNNQKSTKASVGNNKRLNDEIISETMIKSGDLFEFEKNVYPVKIFVSNVLENNERFWYRIDIKLNNGDMVYLSKFYQDFYNFHITLSLMNLPNLPKLPQPIKSLHKDKKYYENLLVRCNELNVYLNKLIKIPEYQKSNEFYDWIINSNKLVNPENNSNEFINDKLYTNSVNLIDLMQPHHNSNKKNFSPTAPLPNARDSTNVSVAESPSLQSLSSLIGKYETDTSSKTIYPKSPTKSDTTIESDNISNFSGSPKTPKYSDNEISPETPITPIFEDNFEKPISASVSPITASNSPVKLSNGKFLSAEFIKIKVYLNNEENDIIVLKVKNTNLQSLTYLKKIVSYKIYKDYELIHHYKLTVSNKNFDDDELLTFVKSHHKVNLNFVRIRGCL